MNDDKKNQPLKENEFFDETQEEFFEISKEELKRTLEAHNKWLETDGKEGKWADLSFANIEGADLRRANLQGADLSRANLQKADFRRTNLQNVNLKKAEMQNIALDGVYGLDQIKDLRYAKMEGVIGFLGHEFAQTDLTGTILPKNIEDFKSLETVKETSQNARKIFFAMLLGCVYSWLTIATTTDVRLLTNTASSPLPIIGTEIPIAWFYIAAPLVLICLYFYFHLYLDNLWEGLASLPAIFPDGKRLDQRAYPWLLNTLVRKHFKLLKKRTFIARMKELITIFLAWWVVPITMIAFWLRYIPRHDWWGTCFHIGLILVSVAFGIIFYRMCASSLQRETKIDFQLIKFWKDRRLYYGVIIIVVGTLFSLLSYGAIKGVRPPYPLEQIKINYLSIKETIPWAFEKIGYDVFADFREKDISIKPSDFYKIEPVKKQIESVKGANLVGRNLNNADMFYAFLVKADLRGANLERATLTMANLEEAKMGAVDFVPEGRGLRPAPVIRAILKHARRFTIINLKSATLFSANLKKSNLYAANLQQSDLTYANFKDANLHGANLQHASLFYASFDNTDLTGAKNLTIEQLKKVKTLYNAKLDPELMEQVKKCCPHLLEELKKETDQKDETE